MSNPSPQVFLSYNSCDKQFVEHVARKLEREQLRFFFDDWDMVPGDMCQPRIEQALRDSSCCVVFVGPAGIGKWQDLEMRAAIQRRVSDDHFRVIPVLIITSGSERGDRADLPSFLKINTWVEFKSSDDSLAFERLKRAIQRRPLRDIRQTIPPTSNPYPGLKAFAIEDEALFCGREVVTDWLLSMLRGTQKKGEPRRFLAIVGASGSGKSSLARAGLLAAIQRGDEIEGSQNWLITKCVPGEQPLESLAVALAQTPGIMKESGSAANVARDKIKDLKEYSNTLRLTSLLTIDASDTSRRHVVFVDQFEEVFTACQDKQLRDAFIDNLLEAGLMPGGKTIVLITMRADFYEACASHKRLAEAISERQFLLGPLNRDELRQAIETPALLGGGTVDQGLTNALLQEMDHEDLALPLLQHALQQLWTVEPTARLSMEKYQELKGLRGALQQHADRVYEQMSSEQQAVCREVLVELVNVSDPTRETRRRVLQADLRSRAKRPDLVDEVVKILVEQRLVSTSAETSLNNATVEPTKATVEVAHEALIRGWSKLSDWVDQNRQERRLQQQFQDRVREWSRFSGPSAQKDELLYTGNLLRQAVAWDANKTLTLTTAEDEFLSASVARLVDQLPNIKLQRLADFLKEFVPFLDRARQRLVELFKNSPPDSSERTVASLALLPIDPTQFTFLRERLLSGNLEEFSIICESLVQACLPGTRFDLAERVTDWLWQELESPPSGATSAGASGSRMVSGEQRAFRAGMALARFTPPDSAHPARAERWERHVVTISAHLVAELCHNPATYENLVASLEPLGRLLVAPLADLARKHDDAQRRSWATKLVSHFGQQDAKLLFDLACDVADERYGVLLEPMMQHGASVIAAAEQELLRRTPANSDWMERDRLAQRQANAAATLMRLDATDAVWPLWRHTSDPSCRSWLIHRVGPLGVDPRLLAARLWDEPDLSARRALILALGEQISFDDFFRLDNLDSVCMTSELLAAWYREHPDAGIHGAAAWTLGRWGRLEPLPPNARPNPTSVPVLGTPSWEVNGIGQTLVVIRGPVEFSMGSPTDEDGRTGGPHDRTEQQHRKRIGRSFALASQPVTVAQFQQFRPDHAYDPVISPTARHPMNKVSWYDAAAYCNWLSEREGIDRDQWCYDPDQEFSEGMQVPQDFLQRTGYRLPTEAEWEYACRAETASRYYFGESEQLLPPYVWYTKTSDDRSMRATGERKPNDWGLDDMLGNVLEWCYDQGVFYDVAPDGKAADDEPPGTTLDDRRSRILRGGSYMFTASGVRSAYRHSNQPDDRYDVGGFRLARTYP